MKSNIDFLEIYQELFNESDYPFDYSGYNDSVFPMHDEYISNLEESDLIVELESFITDLFKDKKGMYFRYSLYFKNGDNIIDFKESIESYKQCNLKMNLLNLINECIEFIELPKTTQEMMLIKLEIDWNKEEIELLEMKNNKLMYQFINLKM